MTPAFPSEVPTPGRWIRSDRSFARGTRPRAREIGRPILSNPIRWRPARRPRTEARPRRTDVSQVKKGIDKPRPVTEADVGPKGLVVQEQLQSERAQHRFNLAEKERELAVALELAEARPELARRDRIEAFARAPSPSAVMH